MTAMPRLPWIYIAAIVLLVAGCVIFFQRVTEGFTFQPIDDEFNVVFNPHIGTVSTDRVAWAFSDVAYERRYMPLGWVGFSTVFTFASLDPNRWHFAGFLLHGINAMLLFAVLLEATRRWGAAGEADTPPSNPWRVVCAGIGAAFWAWHPLRVESVAWVSGLLYEQAEFFLLAAVWLSLRGAASWPRETGALLCYVASLLTYPLAIGFAPLFLLIGRARDRSWPNALRSSLPFFAAAAVVLAINVVARGQARSGFLPVAPLAEFPVSSRLLQACYLWVYYAWRPLWPFHLRFFDPVLFDISPAALRFSGSALLVVASLGTCLAWPQARRFAAPCLLLHLCVLVPMLGLTERPHFPSDRYSAFPQAVLAAALTLLLTRVRGIASRRWIAAGALVGCIALGLLSSRRTAIWRNPSTLFAHIQGCVRPDQSPLMHFVRPAIIRYADGDFAGAIALLDGGITRFPAERSLQSARTTLERDWSEHRRQLEVAGAPPSTSPRALGHQELGLAAAREGDWLKAKAHLRLARDYAPGFYEPFVNLAIVDLKSGAPRNALSCYLSADRLGGAHFPSGTRRYILETMAAQFAALGENRLAAAVRAHAAGFQAAARVGR